MDTTTLFAVHEAGKADFDADGDGELDPFVADRGSAGCLNGERPGGGSPPDTALPAVRERGEP